MRNATALCSLPAFPIAARQEIATAAAAPPARATAISTLRIRDEPEDAPATRRKVVAVCLLVAVAIHGALALMPLNLGGSPAQYGVAPGDRIEVTLMVMDEAPAPAAEPVAALEPPPPPLSEPVAEPHFAASEPAVETPPQVSSPPQPISRERAAAAPSPAAQKTVARSPGRGQPTVAKPNYLRNPPPKYPPESRKLREQGVVLLKVSVTAEGRAADVKVQRSSGFPRLDTAALQAVRRWEFNPARIGLTGVPCIVEVPVRFGLN